MMKKWLSFVLLAVLALSVLTSCSEQEKEISCQEVVAAYESAGYEVWHKEYPEKEYGYVCCIEVEAADGGHISFYFFETEKKAQAYAKDRQWNVALWLYSVAMFQPRWLTTRTYGCIEIEYDDQALYKPFKALLK